MNRVYKSISLPANQLLAGVVSPAIFTLLTIKQNALKKKTKKRLFKHEVKDFEEVLQAPPSDESANCVVKLSSDSDLFFLLPRALI